MRAAARVWLLLTMLKTIGTVKSVFEKIDSDMKLHHYKIRNFEPNVSFRFERGHFVVKTAENGNCSLKSASKFFCF